jgi:xylose isomerase
MNGASSNPDAHVVAYAAAQVKKGLEIAKKLGSENFGKMITCNNY